MLKTRINVSIDYVVFIAALMSDYAKLHKMGKLNLVELVMYIEKLDEWESMERCLEVLEIASKNDKELKEKYLQLRQLQSSYRPVLSRKLEQFYNRLCNQLQRLNQEIFLLKEVYRWERGQRTSLSTVKRYLQKLRNLGYIVLQKKDKLTGYQYSLRR